MLSQPVWLVADNQQQYLYGNSGLIRTPLADRFVGTAIRAPQLDLFGPSALEWVIKNPAKNAPILHLGDGLNVACLAEYERFMDTMRQARQPWFMAPGNHDGIYYGSAGPGVSRAWDDACYKGGGPITQAQFVERYVNEVLGGRVPRGEPQHPTSSDVGAKRFAAELTNRRGGNWSFPSPVTGCGKPGQQPCPLLTRVAWQVDDAAPYGSFVTQELTLTRTVGALGPVAPIKFILLDTASYTNAPALLPSSEHVNPGVNGDLTETQLSVLESWLKADVAASGQVRPIFVLLGHHPFGVLTERAQQRLEALRRKFGVLLYVSAHTHTGQYFVNGPDTSSWLELNIGSMVDWPLEYRDLRIMQTPSGLRYSSSALYALGKKELSGKAPVCAEQWKPQRNDPDYYITYTKDLTLFPEGTTGLIFDSLLASYERMLGFIPSEPNNRQGLPPGAKSDADVVLQIKSAVAGGRSAAANEKKRDLLLALDTFDRERKLPTTLTLPSPALVDGSPPPPSAPQDAQLVHRDYRVCQAIWASQDDVGRARTARREDWYIGYPSTSAP